MATVSCTQCVCALLLTIVLTWLPGEAVYFESAYSTSQKQDRSRNSGSSERQRRGRERSRDNDDDDSPAPGRSERRRDPFQRTIVLCYDDDECGRKHFCHGGEGHRSCVPCRKSRKRCHRHDMCCPGYACQDGRCRLRESRADNNRDDEMSYSEAEDSFWNVEVPRKKHHGEDCENSDDCIEGLCCARHLWSRVCMPMLDEGDLCVKKKDRVSDLFQRCGCKSGLSCKRVPDINTRLHACFPVKSNQASEVVVVDNAQMSSRRESVDNDNDVPLSSGQSKSKRSHPSAEPNEMNEQRAVFSIDQNPHRTVLKRSDSFKDKASQTIVVS